MSMELSERAQARLSLIAAQSDIHGDQMGYWTDLRMVRRDSLFKVRRLASRQAPNISRKLNDWFRESLIEFAEQHAGNLPEFMEVFPHGSEHSLRGRLLGVGDLWFDDGSDCGVIIGTVSVQE